MTHAVICGQVVGNMVLTGNGDGNIQCFDINQGLKCAWGYGADEVTVHCLKVAPDMKSVLCGGEKGMPLKVNLI